MFVAVADPFLSPAALRQPAATIGPRAQRTVGRILDATREVFLDRGYAGTTVDEIARVADVSRASFYTYFPSKREVLLAVGETAASESLAVMERLAEAGSTRTGLRTWVDEYFAVLDVHGAFAFAWTQAAQEDDEIRAAGMKRHLGMCRTFGVALAATARRTNERPELVGLVASSLLERSWNYCRLYSGTVARDDVVDQAAGALWALARQR